MPIFGLRPPEVIQRLSRFARTNARMASRLYSCSRASCASGVSLRRMLSPPSGRRTPWGVAMPMRSSRPSTTAVDSMVSFSPFSATQVPAKRLSAKP